MASHCGYCGSDLGYYDGPNGPRCLNCFRDATEKTAPASEAATGTEPNRDYKEGFYSDKAVGAPEPTATVSGKRAKGKRPA